MLQPVPVNEADRLTAGTLKHKIGLRRAPDHPAIPLRVLGAGMDPRARVSAYRRTDAVDPPSRRFPGHVLRHRLIACVHRRRRPVGVSPCTIDRGVP
jgi:hypothetical protein